jgi:hypothetical protein
MVHYGRYREQCHHGCCVMGGYSAIVVIYLFYFLSCFFYFDA